MPNDHKPVLLQETIDAWLTDKQGIYIDGTFGRGGHSKALLDKLDSQATLMAIDQDEAAITYAKQQFKDKRFSIEHGSFGRLAEIASKHNMAGKVSGILLDIGVSSPQLDEAERGFSFLKDGPLDMRMNQQQDLDAKAWVNNAKEEEMITIFKSYGEEKFAKRIARAICECRKEQAITRTKQLADIIAKANPKWEKHKHPATRVFQAIRIHINNELGMLEQALKQSIEILKPGGRLVVISFHSLEDRIVKRFFKQQAKGKALPKGLPIRDDQLDKKIKIMSKAIKTSDLECKENPRARSAVLRIAEKL